MIFPKDVSLVLSIRYDNLTTGIAVSDAVGLQLDLGGDKFTGFDTDGTDYRIYAGWHDRGRWHFRPRWPQARRDN